MARFVYILFAVLLIATVVLAKEETCSPWAGLCNVHEQCCRHYTCSSYQAKCIPMGGLIIPGQDTRPLGNGPWAPKGSFPAFEATYPHLFE